MGMKFSKILEKITWKHWLVFLILSQGIYAIMLTYTIPYLQGEAGGLKIFDMSPLGYTYAAALLFLTRLSGQGYDFYKHVQLPLDIFFPLFNSLFAIFTFVLLKRFFAGLKGNNKVNLAEGKLSLTMKVLLTVPIWTLVFDYAENLTILTMLSYKAAVPRIVVSLANSFTILKSTFTIFFYLVILILCIMIGVELVKKQIKRVSKHGELQSQRKEKSST